MYLRTSSRRTRDGSEVRYLQLAHNEWDREAGQSRAKVIYNFGREDRAAFPSRIGGSGLVLQRPLVTDLT